MNATRPRVLMCEPKYFGVEYVINPWMEGHLGLARAGVGSRRSSEDLIREGRVTVNGREATLGDKVDPSRDRVAVDWVRVPLDPELRYFALNKPSGVLSTIRRIAVTGVIPRARAASNCPRGMACSPAR